MSPVPFLNAGSYVMTAELLWMLVFFGIVEATILFKRRRE